MLVGGVANLSHLKALFNAFNRAAHVVYLLDVVQGLGFQLVGQALHVVGAAQWIDHIGRATLKG